MTATLHYQNAELSYQLGGKADAPAIVLLHGGLGSAEDFAPLLPRLQAHFRTLAIDTRGHGRSTHGRLSKPSGCASFTCSDSATAA